MTALDLVIIIIIIITMIDTAVVKLDEEQAGNSVKNPLSTEITWQKKNC